MLRHKPVLLQEVLDSIQEHAAVIMDGTFGHGGHTQAICEKAIHEQSKVVVVGVDRDSEMGKIGATNIEEYCGLSGEFHTCIPIHSSYADLERVVELSGVDLFDFILLDIGVNMQHFKEAGRGFSIKLDGKLDMRYDRTSGVSLSDWLEKASYAQLLDVFMKYCDFGEKFITKITKDLVVYKKSHNVVTTASLRERAKSKSISDKKLAVLFQALRIVTNNELGELEKFLQSFTRYLKPGGRCGIMSYHSGEDRIVKYAFKKLVEQGMGTLLTKKVIKPHRKEVKRNKAARSAKYRVWQKNG